MSIEVLAMDDTNWMDYSLNDVPMQDPFLSLSLPFQADLTDISDVIRQNQDPSQLSPNNGVNDYFRDLGDTDKMEINSLVSAMEKETTHFFATDPGCSQATGQSHSNMNSNHMVVHPMRQAAMHPVAPPAYPYPVSQYQPPPFQQESPFQMKNDSHFRQELPVTSEPMREVVVKREVPSIQLTVEDYQKIEAVKTLASLGPHEVDRLVKLASSSKEATENSSTSTEKSPKVGIATKMKADMAKLSPGAAVQQTAQEAARLTLSIDTSVNSSDGVSPRGYDSGDESDNSQAVYASKANMRKQPTTGKIERRSAHNLIEKKYRCSINDKINEIKELIAGNEPKISKSSILKKAVDYIWQLRSENENLKKQNNQLKQALAAKGGAIPLSPERDSTSSPDAASDSSSPQPRPVVKTEGGRRSTRTMPDRSRVTLFVFMMGIMVVNPLAMLMDTNEKSAAAGQAVRGPSRTLLSATFDEPDESWWHERLFRLMCMWLLNGMIIACVLARIFIYGEPVTSSDSQSWNDLQRIKLKAKTAAAQGKWTEAIDNLCDCLRQLGRPPPSCALDEWAAFLWQIFRQFLHRLWVGEYLSKQRRGGFKSQSVMQSHAETAVIYKQLLEINLITHSQNTLNCLTTALSAVNLAEASGSCLATENLVEIYVLAAMELRKSLGNRWKLLQMYLMKRAESAIKKSSVDLPTHLAWIFSPAGAHFLATDPQPSYGVSESSGHRNVLYPFCTPSKMSLYLGALLGDFKYYLLEKLLNAQLYSSRSGEHTYSKTINGLNVYSVMEWCELLLECSAGDELCTWWTQLLTSAVCWASGNRDGATHRYKVVRVIPKQLLTMNLALSLGHSFCARRMCLDNCWSDKYEKVVWFHCSSATKALRQLTDTTINNTPNDKISQQVRLLSYDWLQRCCVDIWWAKIPQNDAYWTHPASSALQQFFASCLNEYRHLIEEADSYAKMLLLECMARMLSGANPVQTSQYLRRCSNCARSCRTITDTDFKYMNQLVRMHSSLACL